MKLSAFITFLAVFELMASSTYSQEARVSLKMDDTSIKEVLLEIENTSEFFFLYNNELVDVERKVDVEIKQEPISDALNHIFEGQQVQFSVMDRQIIISPESIDASYVQAISKTITGKVVDDSGEALPGVTVIINGSTTGTITDVDGKYSLSNVKESDILIFSFIGMRATEVLVGDQTAIDITLKPDAVSLDEIVAIGYGTARKKDLTSAVGSVTNEDFQNQPITEVSQVLQGRSAGVSVIKASGAPGGTARIRVRGSNSITGNNDPLYVIDGLVGGDFNSLNPNDIEDMQILKDASATAVYGSRGANGVVIITTKGGRAGENKISFRATYSLSNVIDEWDLLGAGEYADVANDYYTALGNTPPFTDQDVQGFYKNGGSDWQDLLLRTAKGQDYQLSFSGGNETTTYYVSGNLTDMEGIVINSDYKRYGLRANISTKFSDKLKANVRTNFTHSEALNNAGGSWGFRTSMNQMLSWAPTTPAYLEDGSINPVDNVGSTFEGPLELATDENLKTANTFTANGNLIYDIIPGLTLDIGLGVRYRNSSERIFNQALLMGLTSDDAASATRKASEDIYYANTNVLTYRKSFDGGHDLTVTAVNEQTREIDDDFNVDAQGLLFPSFGYNNLSLLSEGGGLTGDAYLGERKIRSYVGRVNYVFDHKYYFTASMRRDGSSVFQGDNKWANFPSLSAGWTISEEDFMDVDAIDQLKLRASWGKTGNQAVGVYGTRGQIKTSPPKEISTSFENGESVPGVVMDDPGNKDLKWETTEQINIGVDLALFNRVTFTADYFKKNTYDLLLYVPLPKYSGGGGMYQNVGEVENKGFEFSINADVIDNGAFSWTTNFNATFLNNEVLSLGQDEFGVGNETTEGYSFMVKEGYGVSSFYGLTYLGTWKQNQAAEAAMYDAVPGDPRFLDLQKEGEDGYGVIDSKDKGIIGNGIPNATYGWNNTMKYKKFTVNVFFQAMTGVDRYAQTYALAVTPGYGGVFPTHVDIQDRWDANTNPNSDIPHFSSTAATDIQTSRFVMDASFLRLKNLSVGYDIALGEGKNLSLMLAGTNLLTFTKYKGLDPEAYSNQDNDDSLQGLDMGSYPNSRMYSLSATINF
ncbi:TonB-dependent receptor [Labilibacter marinus]|uniref:TonB-dependent receptor n=1 Tax=Labilibacter marinus TaxID=1477105 RepID=UPI0013014DB1|nr:TonB-dependent receptor [Labilibacter marinus]